MIEDYKSFKEYIKTFEEKPRLLLHSCCAPCSSHCLMVLNDYFNITIYFSNDFQDENTTEIWLDIDKNNDLYFIYKNPEIKINDVETITKIIVNWLLG